MKKKDYILIGVVALFLVGFKAKMFLHEIIR